VEIILLLYVLSGILKGFLIFFNIVLPIDITLLTAVMSLIGYFIVGKGGNFSNRFKYISLPVILFLLFWFWMVFSLTYTSSSLYAYEKCLNFGTNLIPIFILLDNRIFDIKKFLRYYPIFLIPLVIIYIPYANIYNNSHSLELSSFVRTYLSLGDALGLLIISYSLSVNYIWNKNVDQLISLFSFLLLLLIGARGPLFFTIIVMFCDLIFRKNRESKKWSLKQLIIVSIIPFIYIFINYQDVVVDLFLSSMSRITLLVETLFSSTGKLESSSAERVRYAKLSLDIIFENFSNFFVGTGIGSFRMEISGVDGREYPHNQILEVWTELGLVGFIIYSVFVVSLLQKRIRNYIYISDLIILYCILNLLKSSSLVDIRMSMCFICLAICSSNNLIKNGSN
jgi:hypothetical protein